MIPRGSTKLVCTLGPASATPKMVQGLARAGASVFRLNMSHGTPEEHARIVDLVRGAEGPSGRALALLADLATRGLVRPVMERRFTLDEAPEAIRVQGEFHARGKSVVVP